MTFCSRFTVKVPFLSRMQHVPIQTDMAEKNKLQVPESHCFGYNFTHSFFFPNQYILSIAKPCVPKERPQSKKSWPVSSYVLRCCGCKEQRPSGWFKQRGTQWWGLTLVTMAKMASGPIWARMRQSRPPGARARSCQKPKRPRSENPHLSPGPQGLSFMASLLLSVPLLHSLSLSLSLCWPASSATLWHLFSPSVRLHMALAWHGPGWTAWHLFNFWPISWNSLVETPERDILIDQFFFSSLCSMPWEVGSFQAGTWPDLPWCTSGGGLWWCTVHGHLGDKSCGWGRFLRRGCGTAALLRLRGEEIWPKSHLRNADLRVSWKQQATIEVH